MKHFGYAYPWNIHDASGFAAGLAELGLDGVNLAVSYHAGKFIHPTSPQGRVHFPEDGTVYFRPQKTYGALKPQSASLHSSGEIIDELGKRVPVNAWVVLGHNSRLGFAHPQCVVRNAFGDPYYYSLCPSHPDVRAYAAALCADLADTHDFASLLLETPGFLTYSHGYHHEFAQVRPNPYLDALLGLCFCQHCTAGAETAGIDVAALRRSVAEAIDGYLAEEAELDHAGGLARLAEANVLLPGLADFHRWRCDQVTALVSEVRAAVRAEVQVRTIATCQRPHATSYLEGMDLPALTKAAEGVECPLYQSDLGALQADIDWLKSHITCADSSAILRPAWPDWSDEASLRAAYAAAREAGFEQINFYNLGMLRPANRRWLQRLLTESR